MKKYWWLGLVLFLVPAVVKADGMVIHPPTKPVYETGQKAAIWWDGKTETIVLSTTFRGEADDFAWVIPVPSKPEVTAGKDELFTSLNTYTQPKYETSYRGLMGIGSVNYDMAEKAPSVTVLETKKVDIYDIAVLEATGGKALREWLTENGYEYPTNRDFLLQYYINKNWYFVAARVSTEALGYVGSSLKEGHANPLTITFASAGIVYPLKISGPGSKYNEADKLAAFSWEQGAEGWYTGEVSGDAAFEGKKSFKMTARTNQYRYLSGVTPTPIPINQTTVRTISGLKKGTDYVVSAYINVPAAEKGEAKIRISGSGTSEVSETVNLPQVTGWRRLDVGFRPTYDGSVAVTLAMEKVEEKTVVYWDGVQVEKGTKPTEFTEEVIPGETTGYTNQNMNIILYVFANHKKTTTSFNTEYAGYVPAKDIQKMAYNDDGTPWMKTSKKMYLTKLTRNMSQAQMTDDLVIRDADDNDTVGGGQAGLIDGWWKAILVLGVPVTAEIVGVCYFWYSRSIKKKETIG